MTQEDKELLLKDLCARLPYGLKVWNSEFLDSIEEYHPNEILTISNLDYYIKESIEVKPYLRPMSSMTEEEIEELCKLCDLQEPYTDTDYFSHYGIEIVSRYCVNSKLVPESIINYKVIDFYLSHHLDWRGLIPEGLALEAPERMYNFD